MVDIAIQMPGDGPAIEHLLDHAFGPGRLGRPSYRLRDGVAPLAALGFAARDGGRMVGTIRFWPVAIDMEMGGAVPALLLGPLAVDPTYRRQAIASKLVAAGLERATGLGHRIVAAVGDDWLFGKFGFAPAAPLGLSMPGPVDEARFLVLALDKGALDGIAGVFRPASTSASARPIRRSALARGTGR